MFCFSVFASCLFKDGHKDVRTLWVKIMTIYAAAGAWRVKRKPYVALNVFLVSFSFFVQQKDKLFLCTCGFVFDPRGRPTVTAGSDHYFRTYCLSVRPHFSKYRKTKSSSENSDHYFKGVWARRVDH